MKRLLASAVVLAGAARVDNGFTLFVNGTEIASGNAEGNTYRWEYSGNIPEWVLRPGSQVIALALGDHGFLTAFDMEVGASPVPEPSTLVLVGLGAIAAGIRKRRGR